MFENKNLEEMYVSGYFETWKIKKTIYGTVLFKKKGTFTWMLTDGKKKILVRVADTKTSIARSKTVKTMEELEEVLDEKNLTKKISMVHKKKWDKIKKRVLKLKTKHRWVDKHTGHTITAVQNTGGKKLFEAVGISEGWSCIFRKDGSVIFRTLEKDQIVTVPVKSWLVVDTGHLKTVNNKHFLEKYKKLKNP